MAKKKTKKKIKKKALVEPSKSAPSVFVTKKFAELYEIFQDPVMVVDELGLVIYSNTAAELLTGYGRKELVDKHVWEVFRYSCKKKVELACETTFAIGHGSSENLNDLKLYKKSGRKVHIDFSIKNLNSKNQNLAVISCHDLTQMLEHQKEKEAYQKEMNHMSKLADIGRLTAGVAHELNNPLMIIQGFSENIQLLFEEGNFSQAEVLRQIDPIVKASDRMAKIISTMMKLARDDDVFMAHVDLVEVIEDALLFLKHQFSDFKIRVSKDFESGIGIVNCDPNQVEQIILNILNNAMHALESNPEGERELKIEIHKNEKVQLKIWNNGPLIPEEIKERVMTPFFTTKPVGDGTGLGLSLSYGIMKAHDGDLTFTSTEEDGTEFTLSFPASKLGENLASFKSPRKFMVIDDEEFIRDLMSHKLRRYGYNVLVAENGSEALKILETNPDVECIFTDIRMPVMDGTQLIKEIKKIDKDMLIYAISGYAGRKSLELKVKRFGISGFLTKPIDHMLFSKTINEIEEHLTYMHGKQKPEAV